MIPKNISRKDVLDAIHELNVKGVSDGSGANRYLIKFKQDYFPQVSYFLGKQICKW